MIEIGLDAAFESAKSAGPLITVIIIIAMFGGWGLYHFSRAFARSYEKRRDSQDRNEAAQTNLTGVTMQQAFTERERWDNERNGVLNRLSVDVQSFGTGLTSLSSQFHTYKQEQDASLKEVIGLLRNIFDHLQTGDTP